MSFDLEQIRSRNLIEEIVAEKFTLKKSGSRFVGVEHDSLVVVPNTGFYFWNYHGEHGDVFDFVGRHFPCAVLFAKCHPSHRISTAHPCATNLILWL